MSLPLMGLTELVDISSSDYVEEYHLRVACRSVCVNGRYVGPVVPLDDVIGLCARI